MRPGMGYFVMCEDTDAADQITHRLNTDDAFKLFNGTTLNLHTNLKGKLKKIGKGANARVEFVEDDNADRFEKYGWLGRYFDNTCNGCDPTVAVNVGRQMPQAFDAKSPKGVSLDNPQNYRFLSPEKAKAGQMSNAEDSFRKLNQPEEEMAENSGATISAIHGIESPPKNAAPGIELSSCFQATSLQFHRTHRRRFEGNVVVAVSLVHPPGVVNQPALAGESLIQRRAGKGREVIEGGDVHGVFFGEVHSL